MPRKSRAELALVPCGPSSMHRCARLNVRRKKQRYSKRLSRVVIRCTSLNPMRLCCEPIAKPSSLANWRLHPRNKARARLAIGKKSAGWSSCVRWNPLGTNGLPEGSSLHRVSRQSDVAPPNCAL